MSNTSLIKHLIERTKEDERNLRGYINALVKRSDLYPREKAENIDLGDGPIEFYKTAHLRDGWTGD